MKYKLQPYSIHELGQRQNQEDSMFPAYGKSTSSDRLFILCDGMGGHEKGEVASATVCETMSKCILSRWNTDEPLSDGLLLQAIEEAYDALDAKDNGEEKKMGTTMTFVCFHSDGVTVAHIGDSRVYQLRPAKGKEPARIVFHTRDHSLVNDLIKIGEITEEEAKNHPQKNVITRAMQPCQDRRAKADIAHLTDIQVGDYFFMCSDGMLEQTTDENLLFIVTKPKVSNEQKVEMLHEVTSENKDNHTAHLIHINKVDGVQVVSKQEKAQKPHGTYITPDEDSNTIKKKLPIYILIGLLVLSLIAGGSYYFCGSSLFCGISDNDSINKDSLIDAPKEMVSDTPIVKPTQADTIIKAENESSDCTDVEKTENQNKETGSQEQKPTNNDSISKKEEKHATTINKFIQKKGKDSVDGKEVKKPKPIKIIKI